VIDALARALRLDSDACWHAYRLVGLVPKHQAPAPDEERVPPELLQLMDAFPAAVANVVNRRLDILASNVLADALLSGPPGRAARASRVIQPGSTDERSGVGCQNVAPTT
jgi:hypothetical protein